LLAHPETSQDFVAIRGCILPSWNQPGYGSHHSMETSQTHSHITDIDKQDHIDKQASKITSSFRLLSSGLGWMES
jgi:hypothetical protein